MRKRTRWVGLSVEQLIGDQRGQVSHDGMPYGFKSNSVVERCAISSMMGKVLWLKWLKAMLAGLCI